MESKDEVSSTPSTLSAPSTPSEEEFTYVDPFYELKRACLEGSCEKLDAGSSPLREIAVIKKSSERGCLVCQTLLAIVDELNPGWTTGFKAGKRINVERGVVSLIQERSTTGSKAGRWIVDGDGIDCLVLDEGPIASYHLRCCCEGSRISPSSLIFGNWLSAHSCAKSFCMVPILPFEIVLLTIIGVDAIGDMYPSNYVKRGFNWHSAFLFWGVALDVIADSSTIAALERARSWLSYCEKHDQVCRPSPSRAAFIPGRLLDVQHLILSNKVVLFEPTQPEKYVALSYCWGKDLQGVLTTTSANIGTHYRGIDIKALPKTIQDAVAVCRGLRIRNLWVDALCIIQDDKQDWERQSSKMLEIYAMSHLTIFANGTDSCKKGFLGPQSYGRREWQRRLQTRIPSELFPPALGISVHYGKAFSSRIIPGSTSSDCRMAESKLDTRGWCLQEEMLPNRRLYIDGNEMTWECCCRSFCECGHINQEKGYNGSCYANKLQFVSLKGVLGLATQESFGSGYYPSPQKVADWRPLVENYTTRLLTNPDDKLVGISGLAKIMLEATEIQNRNDGHESTGYFAGLWEENFLQELSWVAPRIKSNGPWSSPSRSATYRAPTWSWASNNAPVEYIWQTLMHKQKNRTPHMTTRTAVGSIWCESVSSDNPTGSVKAGHAWLTGPLIAVELVRLDRMLSRELDYSFKTKNKALKPDSERSSKSIANSDDFTVQLALVRSKNLLSYPVRLDVRIGKVLTRKDTSTKCWMERRCKRRCCKPAIKASSIWNWPNRYTRKLSHTSERKLFCFELFSWENNDTDNYSDELEHYPGMPPETWFLLVQETPEGNFERVGAGYCSAVGDEDWPRLEGQDSTFECPLFENCEIRTIKIV